jgi:sugar transferase (PEP-CTERM/EpsH1 system associated)
MRDLLYLAHRFPYPPDKGEKIRAWHQIRHFARTWRVHLGCLSDNPADFDHIATLQGTCASVGAFPIAPRTQKLRALTRLRPGRPLMLDYYGHAGLHQWVRRTLAERPVALAVAYTAPMADYLPWSGAPPFLLDLVDVDSEKFAAYATEAGFPMRHVWAREARTLRAYEERAALAANLALLCTEAEARHFGQIAPRAAGRVHALHNGVDLDSFNPRHGFPTPYPDATPRLVLTGHMDYPPNAAAAAWFAREVMPLLRKGTPAPHFVIVGANPGPATLALAAPDITVTGRVPDVRPYLAHAAAAVAPLRIARGIQNKVLEAMAMARPVVASPQGFEGVEATPGQDLLLADGAPATAAAIATILAGHHPTLGQAARNAMERNYDWETVFTRLDTLVAGIAR